LRRQGWRPPCRMPRHPTGDRGKASNSQAIVGFAPVPCASALEHLLKQEKEKETHPYPGLRSSIHTPSLALRGEMMMESCSHPGGCGRQRHFEEPHPFSGEWRSGGDGALMQELLLRGTAWGGSCISGLPSRPRGSRPSLSAGELTGATHTHPPAPEAHAEARRFPSQGILGGVSFSIKNSTTKKEKSQQL
jgi:hypothetical protein